MFMWILCVIFFISGAAGLLFETLWFRGAGIAFGNSVWASSITLAAYMGGLGLGNLLAGRFGRRVLEPVRVYAILELVIAATGVLLVPLLPALAALIAPLLGLAENGSWFNTPLRLIVVFAFLMIPTTAMGATLPLLMKALCRAQTEGQAQANSGFGKALGYLYGFNTLGAMAGVIAGEMFLVEYLGVFGTGVAAALLNVTAALLSFALAARMSRTTAAAAAPATGDRTKSTGGTASADGTGATGATRNGAAACAAAFSWRVKLILAASCLSGAALLGAEVIWFRFLRLFFLDTDATFVAMLAVVLAGIALGGLAAGTILSRWPQRHDLAATCAALCGVLFVASYAIFDARLAGDIWYVDGASIAKLSMLLMFPAAFASGALFTILGQAIHTATRTDLGTAAALTTANTIGAMLGALLAAFVLLPRAGIENSFWAIAGVYCGATACLIAAQGFPRSGTVRASRVGAAAMLVIAVVLFPSGRMKMHLDTAVEKFRVAESSHAIAVREGLTETIQYLRRDWLGQPVFYRLMTNGFSMSDTQPGSRRYMGLYAYWAAALHPALQSALLISYGVGNTAKSLTQIPSLREIHVVDISRDIIRAANVPYPGTANPLNDPRVRVHIDDGRYFLQATEQRFDLITSEPPPPRAPGVINLYTQEYFKLIRARLNDGGLATYWLPVHNMTGRDAKAIIKGFCNAFDDCGLWGGFGLNWMLTGSRQARSASSLAHFTALWRNRDVAPTLAELGLERPELLGTTFMADADQLKVLLGDSLPLTDNFPKRYSQDFPNDADQQFYASWMDVRKTAARFQSSAWVERFWPTAMRAASADYFMLHPGLNEPEEVERLGLRLQMVAATLDRSDLKTPIYWLLGTGMRQAAIARAAVRNGNPEAAYVLGVDALARREIGRAVPYFEAALAAGDQRALAPLMFSACRTGQQQRARQLAAIHMNGNVQNSLARCW
jgi:spermidine synthase